MKKGIVYLIGAGPGDPGLITVKGLSCLQRADVVVYDRLASPRLLALASPDAELIYVGKSPGKHAMRQAEINRLLVELARQGRVVARLKGGDPFVFGRGGEEAQELAENGIDFEVVPGISSALAAPAYAGIPVTHRRLTSTLAIITGNEDSTKEDTDIAWEKIATGAGTLVFLMGMSNLTHICERLVRHGRPEHTPVALVRWGTRPEQETLVGTLRDIAARAEETGFANPAVIVVGEVVGMRDKLMWFERRPLFGKRIVVTRSREQASALSRAIEELGGEAWEFPVIKITAPQDWGPVDAAIEALDTFDWVIFTSVNGVRYFFERLRHRKRDVRDLKGTNICAIGPKTKEALEQYGLIVEYVPEEFRAERLAEGLADRVRGQRVLLARADIARDVLPQLLTAAGADVAAVSAYSTVLEDRCAPLLLQMLSEKRIHAVTFTSSSTVRNFLRALESEDPSRLLQGVVLSSIGPVTSGTLREAGLWVDVEAGEYTIDGLVRAIADYFDAKRRRL